MLWLLVPLGYFSGSIPFGVIITSRVAGKDVRAEGSGNIGATNVARVAGKKLGALDKAQPYLVHCAVGGRSAKARDLMKTQQFKTIYHLEGGLKAWEKAGKPVER